MRLIDADKIVYSWQIDADGNEHDGVTLQSIIDKMPTIEERKTGEWIGEYPVTSVCSECRFLIHDSKVKVFAYCPNCGAWMGGTP